MYDDCGDARKSIAAAASSGVPGDGVMIDTGQGEGLTAVDASPTGAPWRLAIERDDWR